MAIKVKSIVILLALVGCTLISAVASSETETNHEDRSKTEIERLKNDIEQGGNKPEEVEEMLKNFEYQSKMIGTYFVDQLVKLCQKSLSMCFDNKLNHIIYVTSQYWKSFPDITKYGHYCKEKMEDFCVENIEKVTENLLKTVTEDEKDIAKPFWDSVRSSGLMERAHKHDIAFRITLKEGGDKTEHLEEQKKIYAKIQEAFLEYQQKEYGANPSVDVQESFFYKFARSMKRYAAIYDLYIQIQKNDRSAPDLKDETAIDLFKFGRIANMSRYNREDYFKELAEKMTTAYGCKYNVGSWTFVDQSKEDFDKRRAILEEKKSNLKTLGGKIKNLFGIGNCFRDPEEEWTM